MSRTKVNSIALITILIKNRASEQSFNCAEVRDNLIQNSGKISEYFAENIVFTCYFSKPKMIIICTPQFALFYIPADNKDDDKFHVVKGMKIDDIIQRLIMDELSYSEAKCSQNNLALWDQNIKSLENLINH